MRTLAAAAMLLTRVPMPSAAGQVPPARAAVLYPVVGAATGAAVAAVGLGGAALLTVPIAAVLAVAAEAALTGALHLDGLADSADGLAGRDRPHRLRIMKDHAVGVYAATTVVLHLLLKVAVVAALLDALPPGELLVLLTGVYGLSRGAILPLARVLPYARAHGTGRAVVEGLGTAHVATGLAIAAAGSAAVVAADPWLVPALVLTAALTTLALGLLARRRLGGVTGDVLGACAELTLVAMLLVAAAVLA